jgi:secreted trypsin-like serine protease
MQTRPLVRAAVLALATAALAGQAFAARGVEGLTYEATNWYFTTQPSTPGGLGATPYNVRHRPLYGGEMSGVADLFLGGDPVTGLGTGCSGSLLSTGRHILTAAHCVTDRNGKIDINFSSTINVASFPSLANPANPFQGGFQDVNIIGVKVHPGWTGNATVVGNDLAVLTLAEEAPGNIQRYELYTGGSDMGVVGTKVGWGNVGLGSDGVVQFSGWRMGQNVWDLNAAVFWGPGSNANPAIGIYDFDNGKKANDAFGYYFDLNNLGLGDMEVGAGNGDSGGPTFIDGKVAGITSFGLTFFSNSNRECFADNPDFVCGLNSSFGEFGGDTRVSYYSEWITASIPEPGTYALMGLGLLAVGTAARRRRV